MTSLSENDNRATPHDSTDLLDVPFQETVVSCTVKNQSHPIGHDFELRNDVRAVVGLSIIQRRRFGVGLGSDGKRGSRATRDKLCSISH